MLHRVLLTTLLAGFLWSTHLSLAIAKTRVLVLHPFSETLLESVRAGTAIRNRLVQQYGADLDLYSEYLDLARFPGEKYQIQIAKHLAEKYTLKPLSLTVAVGASALNFALNHRHALGSATPIVYCCVRPSRVAELTTATKVFGLLSDYDVRETVEFAMRLQPTARQLLVISGASEVDRRFEMESRQSLEAYSSRLTIEYLSGVPRDELLRKVSNTPRNTIVLFLTYLMDGAGRQLVQQEVAAEIAEAASAPMYAIFDTLIGSGVVGGHMDTFEDAGMATAELAIQVLTGTVPLGENIRQRSAHNYFVDVRQLERWNLSRSGLPLGTILKFEKAPVWETHREEAVTAMVAFGIVTLTLAILLAQVRRRKKAEAHLKQSEERLNFAAASGGIGLWQYDMRSGELWLSEHCRAIFGLSPDRLPSIDVLLACVHPQDCSIARTSIRAATDGLRADTLLDFRIVRPDGQVRSIRSRSHSTMDGEGNPIRISGAFRDLTNYRSIQKEAKELSRRILSIQDEERQRIAQELHDSTAQHLAAINLNFLALQCATPRIARDAPIFSDIQTSLVAAMNEMRTFTYLLYPQELAHLGLHEALTRYVKGFSQRTGLAVDLRITMELDELAHSLKQTLLRIMQESLANVHRHASATRVVVRLQRRGGRVHLLIADNGTGMPNIATKDRMESAAVPLGVGIPGMMARARRLGGELNVRGTATGTVVHASLPIDYEDQATAFSETNAAMRVSGNREGGQADTSNAKRSVSIVSRPADRSRHVHGQDQLRAG